MMAESSLLKRRILVAVLLAATMGMAACGSRGAPATGRETASTSPPAASRSLSPRAFAAAVAAPGVTTINVHVPYAGEISGTDLFIPFDQITTRTTSLPARSAPLAIYCRSGRMSAIAARTLSRLGYRSIVELRGGMDAWQQNGRALRRRPPA
jgi:phage shock protein E